MGLSERKGKQIMTDCNTLLSQLQTEQLQKKKISLQQASELIQTATDCYIQCLQSGVNCLRTYQQEIFCIDAMLDPKLKT